MVTQCHQAQIVQIVAAVAENEAAAGKQWLNTTPGDIIAEDENRQVLRHDPQGSFEIGQTARWETVGVGQIVGSPYMQGNHRHSDPRQDCLTPPAPMVVKGKRGPHRILVSRKEAFRLEEADEIVAWTDFFVPALLPAIIDRQGKAKRRTLAPQHSEFGQHEGFEQLMLPIGCNAAAIRNAMGQAQATGLRQEHRILEHLIT